MLKMDFYLSYKIVNCPQVPAADKAGLYLYKKYREYYNYISSLFVPELRVESFHFDNDCKFSCIYRTEFLNSEQFEQPDEILKFLISSFLSIINNCYEKDLKKINSMIDRLISDFSALKQTTQPLNKSELQDLYRHIALYNQQKRGYYRVTMYSGSLQFPSLKKLAGTNLQEPLFLEENPEDDSENFPKESINEVEDLTNISLRRFIASRPMSIDKIYSIDIESKTMIIKNGREKINLCVDGACILAISDILSSCVGEYVFTQVHKVGKRKEIEVIELNATPADYE